MKTALTLAAFAALALFASAIATPITTAPHWAVVQGDGGRETTNYYYLDSGLQVTDLPETTYSQTYYYSPGSDGCYPSNYRGNCNYANGCNGQTYYRHYEMPAGLRYGTNVPGAYEYPYLSDSNYDDYQDHQGYYQDGYPLNCNQCDKQPRCNCDNYYRWTYTGLGYDGHYNPWYNN